MKMKLLEIVSILLICFFLSGCDMQDIWSQPSAFGLPLGVVFVIWWAVTMINNNNNRNAENLRSDVATESKPRSTSSNLVSCKTCGKSVSKNANTCPHCGEPNFKTVSHTTRSQKPSVVKPPFDYKKHKTKSPKYYKERNLRKRKNKDSGIARRKQMALPNYYYHDVANNEVKGPLNQTVLYDLEATNEIDELTQVCKEGLSDWITWGEIK